MDGASGVSTGEDEVAGVRRDESKLEWLVRGCRRAAGSYATPYSIFSVLSRRRYDL